MTLAFRTAAKMLSLIASPLQTFKERQKKDACEVLEDVHIYPSANIFNFQSGKSAIRLGPHTHVRGELLVFAHGGKIRVGNSCFIGEDSRVWSATSITIGNRVLVSHCVNIHDSNAHSLSAAHRYSNFRQIVTSGHPSNVEDVPAAPIVIEDDVWIGFNSTILKGVTIGRGAVIGAATLVLDDVSPYTVVAGNPARVIGKSLP